MNSKDIVAKYKEKQAAKSFAEIEELVPVATTKAQLARLWRLLYAKHIGYAAQVGAKEQGNLIHWNAEFQADFGVPLGVLLKDMLSHWPDCRKTLIERGSYKGFEKKVPSIPWLHYHRDVVVEWWVKLHGDESSHGLKW